MKYIFKRIANFILLLKDYGYVHNDIKLDNAMICDDLKNENGIPDDKKCLKMIDIGPSNNILYYEGELTPEYFRQP